MVDCGHITLVDKAAGEVGVRHEAEIEWALAGAASRVDISAPTLIRPQLVPKVLVEVVVQPSASAAVLSRGGNLVRAGIAGARGDIARIPQPMHAAQTKRAHRASASIQLEPTPPQPSTSTRASSRRASRSLPSMTRRRSFIVFVAASKASPIQSRSIRSCRLCQAVPETRRAGVEGHARVDFRGTGPWMGWAGAKADVEE